MVVPGDSMVVLFTAGMWWWSSIAAAMIGVEERESERGEAALRFNHLLKSYRLMGYADSTNKCPKKFLPVDKDNEAELNLAYIEWEKMDQLLLGWLISFLTDIIHSQIVGLKMFHEVWSALRRIKCIDSIAAYFHKVKDIAHQLTLTSKPVENDDLVSYILAGLTTHEYGALRILLNTRAEQIELKELLSLLLIHEAQCEANETEPYTIHIANIAYGNQQANKAQSNRPFNR
ncbi:hypothetical protein EJ110_NYTH21185 [Nymphaea thermarum]|nr:hypothetical protein EJ110_NYTH21185 [Nymphaea thermarum]